MRGLAVEVAGATVTLRMPPPSACRKWLGRFSADGDEAREQTIAALLRDLGGMDLPADDAEAFAALWDRGTPWRDMQAAAVAWVEWVVDYLRTETEAATERAKSFRDARGVV